MGDTQLNPRVVTLWRWQWLLAAGAVLLAAVAATVATALDDGPTVVVGAWGAVLTAVAVGLALWIPTRIYRHWSYRLDPVALEIRHGGIIRRRAVIPYFRVQHVDTSRGPLERRLGLAQLEIHTASSGTDAKIPGIDEATAAELRAAIVSRAGGGAGV